MDRHVIDPGTSVPGSPNYSAAMQAGGWVLPSGQVGESADGSVPASFEEEMTLALANLRTVLEASGSDLLHIVRLEIVLVDMSDFEAMNRVYLAKMPTPLPARFTHGGALAPGYRVELLATAIVAN